MNRNLLLSEFFDIVNKQENDTDRLNLLKQEKSPVVQTMLRFNFDPNINWLIPEGMPPFKKQEDRPMGYQETTLEKELRRFYIWLDPKQNLNNFRRETLFIELLEGLHYSEALLVCSVKDKTLQTKYKNITEELVRVAYPNMLPPPVKKKRSRTKKAKENV